MASFRKLAILCQSLLSGRFMRGEQPVRRFPRMASYLTGFMTFRRVLPRHPRRGYSFFLERKETMTRAARPSTTIGMKRR